MADAIRYKATVAWRTITKNVYILTEEDIDNPATYRLTFEVIDNNEPGQGQIDIGYGFIDNTGNPYAIIAYTSTTIDVSDIFRIGQCPVSGEVGIVYKNVWFGRGIVLPPIYYRFLHPIAILNKDKYNLDILWSNDPNARRISFTNSDQPQIANYTTEILTVEGDTIIPDVDYGQNPKICLWEVDDSGNLVERTERPYYTLDGNGNIASVSFGTLDEAFTGYILISK